MPYADAMAVADFVRLFGAVLEVSPVTVQVPRPYTFLARRLVVPVDFRVDPGPSIIACMQLCFNALPYAMPWPSGTSAPPAHAQTAGIERG